MKKTQDFIKIRSFLAQNVEEIMESINVRRKTKLNDTDDLFDTDENFNSQKNKLNWKNFSVPKSKFQILSDEKNSLGLYVSGNPLDEYKKILDWATNVSYADNLHLVLIEKIKKIFTKSGGMMLALEITTPNEQLEGLVFPKSALKFSAILLEKEVFWILGKITRKEKKDDEIVDDNEIKEYDQLPKLIIEQAAVFEEGPFSILSEAKISLTEKRKEMLIAVDWKSLKEGPQKFGSELPTKNEQIKKVDSHALRIPRSISPLSLSKIKSYLHKEQKDDYIGLLIEVETSNGWRKSKAKAWVTPGDLIKVNNLVSPS
ncbi:MAG: hypothetical protein WCK98_01425 [bacterium]